jgi:hypothetical protein
MSTVRPLLCSALLVLGAACVDEPTMVPSPTTAPPDPADCALATAALAPLPTAWDGDLATCVVDPPAAVYVDTMVDKINAVRTLAGVAPIVSMPADDAAACALTLAANDSIDHAPGPDWRCVTPAGTDAMARSLTGDRTSLELLQATLIDPGNPTTLGHRRWLLAPWLRAAALATADDKACLDLEVDPSDDGPDWIAWPPSGDTARSLLELDRFTTDAEGWMIQSNTLDLADATVRMWIEDDEVATETLVLLAGFGTRSAIRFVPAEPIPVDAVWTVEVEGAGLPIRYSGRKVDCGPTSP